MRRAGLDPDKDKGGDKYAQNTGRWGEKDVHRIEASQEQMVKEGFVEGIGKKLEKLKSWNSEICRVCGKEKKQSGPSRQKKSHISAYLCIFHVTHESILQVITQIEKDI